MGAHSRPRKGFNQTMAVAIAAGVAVSGGVQIAAPADSILASSANAAEVAEPLGPIVAPETMQFNGAYNRTDAHYGQYNGKVLTQLTRVDNGVGYYDALVALPNYTSGAEIDGLGLIFTNIEIQTEINKSRNAISTYTIQGTNGAKVNPNARWDDGWLNYKFNSPVDQTLTGEILNGSNNPDIMTAKKSTSPGRVGSAKGYLESDKGQFRFTLGNVPRNPDTSAAMIIRDAFTVDFNDPNFDPETNPPKLVFNTTNSAFDSNKNITGRLVENSELDWIVKTQADDNTPTGKKVSVEQNAAVPNAQTAISNVSQLKNVKSYTWKNKPSTANVGSTKQVVVVEYNDGSKDDVTVDFEVTKSTTNADDYQPAPNPQTVKYGDPVVKDPNKLFSNWVKMPNGTAATPVNPPAEVTKPVDVTYDINYPDKSSEQVKVPHVPGKMADAFDPKGKDVKTELNGKPEAKTGIVNIGDMPDGTTYTWKGGAPDTSKRGELPATVVVKYIDNSTDEVPVNVIVEATDAAVYDPKPKPLTVDNGDKPAAADGIANKPDLPKDATYKWEKAPDTSKPGTTNPVAIVTYKDGSTDRVTVPVTVRPMAEVYNPIPQDVTVNRTKQPNAADAIKNKKDLPEGTKYTWKSPVDTSTGGKKPAVVVVTYPDGSREEVSTNVIVRPDNEVYTPTAKPLTVNNGDKPNPADGIGNKNELPEGTKYTWEKAPDTTKPGKTEGVVTVTYPDGTKDRVTVPVTVRTQAEQFDPKPKPIESWTGENPPAIDGILNPDKLPKGTKFVWEKKPDTSKPGDTTGVVKVTYPDGSTDRVTVPVRVFLSGDDYQKILDDIDAIDKEIDRINGEIGKLKGDVNTLKGQMKQAQADIKRLQGQVKDLQDRMAAAEKRLDGHDKDIADLKRRMADAERRLDNIDKQIEQIMAELERLDGNEIVEGVRNADNSITLVKKDGRTVEIAPATKYGLEKCTAQLGGGLMALVPTMIVLSQAGNAVNLPGFEQQMVALQKQVGVYNPQIADFVAKNGPALAAGAVGLAVIGTMFIPGTCGSDSIADALGESLRGNPNAANPDVRETHDFKGPRFVPKPGTEGETATAGSSLANGKDAKPATPADAPATGEGATPTLETAAGATAPAPTPVIDNDTADVLDGLAALAELDNDTEDFDLAVADVFAAR